MFFSPQEDILIKCLRQIWLHRQVNVASVLAAQIMLDIHALCHDQLPSYYRQLLATKQYVHERLESVPHSSGGMEQDGDSRLSDAALNALEDADELHWRVENTLAVMGKKAHLSQEPPPRVYTWSNDTPEMRKLRGSELERPTFEIEKRLQSIMLKYIQPNTSDVSGLVGNRFYASTVPLRMTLQYQAVGLRRANMHVSTFLMAHLYNGLQKLNLLRAERPVMEQIMALHKRAIFADATPTTPENMANRLFYRMDELALFGLGKAAKWLLRPHPATDLDDLLSDDARERARGLCQLVNQSESRPQAAATKRNDARQHRYHSAQSYVRDLQTRF